MASPHRPGVSVGRREASSLGPARGATGRTVVRCSQFRVFFLDFFAGRSIAFIPPALPPPPPSSSAIREPFQIISRFLYLAYFFASCSASSAFGSFYAVWHFSSASGFSSCQWFLFLFSFINVSKSRGEFFICSDLTLGDFLGCWDIVSTTRTLVCFLCREIRRWHSFFFWVCVTGRARASSSRNLYGKSGGFSIRVRLARLIFRVRKISEPR